MGEVPTLPGIKESLCEAWDTDSGSRSVGSGEAPGPGPLAWLSTSIPGFKWAGIMNRPSSKEDKQTANKHGKKCSTQSSVKTTTRYHFSPSGPAIIKSQAITSVGEDVENRNPDSGRNVKMVKATAENIWPSVKG